jgi:hypothetical protein
MAAGFPAKTSFANGNALPASDLNDVTGTLNLINPSAKGDLFVGSAANTYTKLSVGSDGLVLTASSTATTGVAWTGFSGGMTLISSVTPTASSSAVTFSSIPSTYKSLYCVFNSITSTSTGGFNLRMNNISVASSYGTIYMIQGTTTVTTSTAAQILIATTATNYTAASGSFTIPNYTYSTSESKTVFFESSASFPANGTFGGLTLGVGSGNGTGTQISGMGAINRIDILPVAGSFNAVGTIALYGVN